MIDWVLLLSLIVLGCIGTVIILYPLRKKTNLIYLGIPIILSAIFVLYFTFGGWFDWNEHLKIEAKNQKVKELLTKFKDPNDIAERLKSSLKDDKSSAQGWFLLGKIYKSQGKIAQALDVFTKAYNFMPDNDEFAINYVETAWQLSNHAVLSSQLLKILNNVLEKNPKDPDCLSLLAINAYNDKQYSKAIAYWNILLSLVPPESQEAQYLQKAILKAKNS